MFVKSTTCGGGKWEKGGAVRFVRFYKDVMTVRSGSPTNSPAKEGCGVDSLKHCGQRPVRRSPSAGQKAHTLSCSSLLPLLHHTLSRINPHHQAFKKKSQPIMKVGWLFAYLIQAVHQASAGHIVLVRDDTVPGSPRDDEELPGT